MSTANIGSIEDLATRNTFLAERQELVKRIEEVNRKLLITKTAFSDAYMRQHAKICTAWVDAKAHLRSDELDRLRASRHQA
jgi:hypothetical protein